MAKDRANSNHSADRREVLRTIGAASAALGFSPAFPMRATAQSKPGDLPANIAEAGKRFRDRSLGITELTKSYLKGAKELQPKLNQYITLTEEEALKTAAQLESELAQGKARGPLHGIPIVYKDNMDTAGTKTTVGSEFFKDRVFQTVIPRNIRLAEAPSHGMPALRLEPKSKGALAYLALAGEIIRRIEAREQALTRDASSQAPATDAPAAS